MHSAAELPNVKGVNAKEILLRMTLMEIRRIIYHLSDSRGFQMKPKYLANFGICESEAVK